MKLEIKYYNLSFLLFIFLLNIVKSDIPVHCPVDKIAGTWKIYLYGDFFEPKLADQNTTCGHGYPGNRIKDIGYKKYIPENPTQIFIYELRLDFNVYQNGEKVGTWTSVYDQSFLIKTKNEELTANLKYYYEKENSKEAISVCDETMTGWLTKNDNSIDERFSCLVAEKLVKEKKENNFLQIGEKNLKSELISGSNSLSIKKEKSLNNIPGVEPKELLKGIPVKELKNIVEEINNSNLTWKAKLNPDFIEKNLLDYTKYYKLISRDKSFYNDFKNKNELLDNETGNKKHKHQNTLSLSLFLQTKEKKLEIKKKIEKMIKELNEPLKDKSKLPWKSTIKKQKTKDNPKREKDSHYITDPKEVTKYINTPIEEIDENLLPKNWDWRDVGGENYYSEEEEQGDCGSCYTMGTISILESKIRILTHNKDKTKLSAQFPLSCNFYSEGCDGGYPILIGKFFKDFEILPKNCLEYKQGKEVKCEELCDYTKFPKKYIVTDYGYIGGYYGALDEVKMMKELRARGPIFGNLIMPSSFSLYSSGIYSEKEITHNIGHFSKTSMVEKNIFFQKVEHTTTIIGYGEEDGIKYWIGMNSYGKNWGENGYYRILRGENELNIESMGDYINVDIVDRKSEIK